jgi:hypothetical protein
MEDSGPQLARMAEHGRDKARRRKNARSTALAPPLLASGRLQELEAAGVYGATVRQAASRIGEWRPKGVHFGWERSFKN